MIPALIVVLQQAYKLAKDHPDIVEALLGKTLGLLLAPAVAKHNDAAAQAGLVAGLAALASSAATTAMERERHAVENATLPLSADEVFGPEPTSAPTVRPEDAAALVGLLNRIYGAELFAVRGTIDPLSTTQPKEIQS